MCLVFVCLNVMHNTSGKREIWEKSVRIVSWLAGTQEVVAQSLQFAHQRFIYFSFRRHLESRKVLDLSLHLLQEAAGTVVLPIFPSCLSQLDLPSLRTMVSSENVCEIVWIPVIKLIRFYFNTLSAHWNLFAPLFLFVDAPSLFFISVSPAVKKEGQTNAFS